MSRYFTSGAIPLPRYSKGKIVTLSSDGSVTLVPGHTQAGLPGKFAIVQENRSIVGKPESGTLLDRPITVPEAERALDQTAELVAELSKAGGKAAKLLEQPYQSSRPLKFGVMNEPLREVLSKWSEVFGPTAYFAVFDRLAVHIVSFGAVPIAPNVT